MLQLKQTEGKVFNYPPQPTIKPAKDSKSARPRLATDVIEDIADNGTHLYYKGIQAAKRTKTGVRASFVNTIVRIGRNEGLTPKGYKKPEETYQGIFDKLQRIANYGFIYQCNKQYFLTDKGRIVFNAVMLEIGQGLEEIMRYLRAEAMKP